MWCCWLLEKVCRSRNMRVSIMFLTFPSQPDKISRKGRSLPGSSGTKVSIRVRNQSHHRIASMIILRREGLQGIWRDRIPRCRRKRKKYPFKLSLPVPKWIIQVDSTWVFLTMTTSNFWMGQFHHLWQLLKPRPGSTQRTKTDWMGLRLT